MTAALPPIAAQVPGTDALAEVGTTWTTVLLLGLVFTLAAVVQSLVGFGLAVVGAPVAVLTVPEVMPAAVLLASLAPSVWELLRGPRDIDARTLSWALGARILMTPVGVAVVAAVSPNTIAVLVGVMVLVAVAASLSRVQVRPEPRTAVAAGLLTGLSGTAASIGGPFLGLVLQRERPSRIRSTLAVFFVVGALTALLGLAVGGALRGPQLLVGVVWLPFAAVGMLIAAPLRSRVDPARIRPMVLALSTVAGVWVILRSVLG